MRKLNAILSIVVLAVFVLHMAVDSLLMIGVINDYPVLQNSLSWLLLIVVAAHTVIGIKLTADTFASMKKSGVSYMNDNLLFWTRRISGFAVMLFIVLHMAIFINGNGEKEIFDTFGLICSILFILSLILHIVTNIRPLISGLGKQCTGISISLTAFVFSLTVLASGAAFVIYYVKTCL